MLKLFDQTSCKNCLRVCTYCTIVGGEGFSFHLLHWHGTCQLPACIQPSAAMERACIHTSTATGTERECYQIVLSLLGIEKS